MLKGKTVVLAVTGSIAAYKMPNVARMLIKMGADVQVDGTTATIRGIDHLCGANVNALDLRAGAALCIAGLAAEGTTVVDDIHYIKRGYEKFDEKLRSLGGIIEEVDSERALQKARMRIG